MVQEEQLIREYVNYCAETGDITWRISSRSKGKPGSLVGWIERNGYRSFELKRKPYKCHRVAWLLHYGTWPSGQIDHINGDKLDNRIENLRDVTQNQNLYNKPSYRNSTSPFKGVSYRKDYKKWRAVIQKDGKTSRIGHYDCEKEAALAYNYTAERLFGCYARFNEVFDDIRPNEEPS